MITLTRGQKIDLAGHSSLRVHCKMDGEATLNFSCFALNVSSRLDDERNFVFYNQPISPDKAIRLTAQNAQHDFAIELSKLPAAVHKLVFVASLDEDCATQALATCHFRVEDANDEIARLDFGVQNFNGDKAILVAEIYRRDGWRLSALAQGFNGGLQAVLQHFGGQDATAPQPKPVDENVCVRCGKKPSVCQQIRGFNATTRRCVDCERAVTSALEQFRRDFLAASESGILQDASWQAMWTRFDPTRQKVSHQAVLEFIRPDALRFVERLTAMAAADGTITPASEKYIEQMLQGLAIPQAEQRSIQERLDYLKTIARIREGHLPRVATQHHLEAGELCHMEVAAIYRKVTARSTTDISGNLVATSKKLLFLSPTGGWTVHYKNIMRVEETPGVVYLELSTRSGNGKYAVADALGTEAVLTTLTRLAKRQLLGPNQGTMTRHIPQDVKSAVWQRDGGQCVQCRAISYLEFDHIIPFSRGGANTAGNIQLLCRKCNNAKGDRI